MITLRVDLKTHLGLFVTDQCHQVAMDDLHIPRMHKIILPITADILASFNP